LARSSRFTGASLLRTAVGRVCAISARSLLLSPQPRVSVGGQDAYPTLTEKAAALGYSLVRSHGFVDGNKRVAHAAMEVFLVLNGVEITATIDEQERFILSLAAGEVTRPGLAVWLESNTGCLSRES
jgi:death-on-curing protein